MNSMLLAWKFAELLNLREKLGSLRRELYLMKERLHDHFVGHPSSVGHYIMDHVINALQIEIFGRMEATYIILK